MTPPAPAASVVVRTFNSEATAAAALDSLVEQSVVPEIIVVDSGSSDATLDVVSRYPCRVVSLPPAAYTPGRALNLGADSAGADVVFALSSHSTAPSRTWIEQSLAHYDDPLTAATCGLPVGPDGVELTAARALDLELARAHPRWGFSNTASSWRSSVFQQHRFDEQLAACEDKEWALRVLAEGHRIVVDPEIAVDASHRRRAGWPAYFRRVRDEHAALVAIGAEPSLPTVRLVQQWWGAAVRPAPGERGLTSVSRLIDLAALWSAQRSAASGRNNA